MFPTGHIIRNNFQIIKSHVSTLIILLLYSDGKPQAIVSQSREKTGHFLWYESTSGQRYGIHVFEEEIIDNVRN